MVIDYSTKSQVLDILLKDYRTPHLTFMSQYKGVPVEVIDEYKKFIDFTRYYIMYRGPRKGSGNCTLKKDAIKADIYEFTKNVVSEKRLIREDYLKYSQR